MKTVLRSSIALTTAHGFGYAISLAEVPILARALGPEAYGALIWVQVTALLASMLVDYGFTLSASRIIAQGRSDTKMIQKLAGNVFFAKLILLGLVALPLLMLYLWLKPTTPGMALAGFVYLVAFGMSPFWYFQGMERMGRAVVIEIVTRSTALLALFVFVHSPSDSTLALWLMASGALVCTAVTTVMCHREVGVFRASFRGALAQIRHSTPIFIYKSSGNLVATAATTVLGGVAGKAAVGVFAPAEKIVKAVIGLALPLLNAFYPHLSRLFVEDKAKKASQSLLLIATISFAGLIAAIVLTLFGTTIMGWLLGPGFENAGTILALMVWLIPLRLMNQSVGFAVLLPNQMEKRASRSMLVASVSALIIGALLAVEYGAQGMVWGMLLGEVGLLMAQLYLAKPILFTTDRF